MSITPFFLPLLYLLVYNLIALHIVIEDNYIANTLSPHKSVSFLRSCKTKQLQPNEKKKQRLYLFSLVQFSRSVVSDSLRPHESQHARPPFPSPTPGVYSNSGPSSW